MSLAEPPVGTNVSRYGGDRRRYRSGQSDSSANTNSTSYTNNSAPVISCKSKAFRHTPITLNHKLELFSLNPPCLPQKKQATGSEKFVQDAGKVVDSISGGFKEIPNLPKLKLLKLTGFFFFVSTGIWFMNGPYKRLKVQR